VHSSDSELENGQRAGSRIGAVRNLFGRSSINGFDFREAIGNPERGTPKQLGSATMNRGGSENEHHHLLSPFEMHLLQVAEGNGLLMACATSALRIRLWLVC